MRFLLTRPVEDSEKSASLLRQLGHQVYVDPLLEIKKIEIEPIHFEKYQAVIFTSPNSLRSYDYPEEAKSILTFVVGKKTEDTAKHLGFKHIVCGDGDSKKLSNIIRSMIIPKNGPVLYLSGLNVAGSIEEDLSQASFEVDARAIYEAVASETLDKITLDLILKEQIDYLPFYSKRSALIFIKLIKKAQMEIKLQNITALCLSPSVSGVVSSLKWKNVLTSKLPHQDALYNLISIEFEGSSNDR